MQKKTKPRKPRETWERKPMTQVVPNKKGVYKREKSDWRNQA